MANVRLGDAAESAAKDDDESIESRGAVGESLAAAAAPGSI